MSDYDDQDDFEEEPPRDAPSMTSMQCSALSKGDHVVIKGRPCKIIETKHEDDEIHLVAIDIFNGKKYQDVAPPSYNMDVPAVTRTEYQFLYIEDGTLHLLGMNHNDAVKEDVYVPDNEIGEKIRIYDQDGTEIVVTVLSALGIEAAVSVREK